MQEYIPVLVVGGMVSGLSTAVFLAHHNVPVIVVERRSDPSRQPRIRGLSARSMEVFGQVGLEPAIREIDDSAAEGSRVILAESLAGREIKELVPPHDETFAGVSPTGEAMCDQDLLEPVLRDAAQRMGAQVRFGTELVSVTQDRQSVRAVLRSRETGREHTMWASYLVACDGTHSPVRESLDIRRVGPGVFGHRASILFRADLSEAVRGRSIKICLIEGLPGGGLLPRHGGRWQLTLSRDPQEDLPDPDDAHWVELIRRAVGLPGLDPVVLGVEPWEVGALVAERFSAGRIFLVGDAAHVMPSTGGFGGNLCIQDAHNLAWKLAMVIRGTADPGLLDTYSSERQPVGGFTMREAVARTPMFGTRSPADAAGRPLVVHDQCSVVFGYRYRSDAVLAEEPDDGEMLEDPRHPSGRPGTRAGHMTIGRDGDRRSVLDLFGRGYVLLCGPDGGAWREAGAEVPAITTVYQVGAEVDGAQAPEAWRRTYGVGDAGAVLVRPDGFVGWRAPDAVAAPGRILAEAVRRLLCRPATSRNGGSAGGHRPAVIESVAPR